MNCPICRKSGLIITGEINPKILNVGQYGDFVDFESNIFLHISCSRCGYDGKYESEEISKIPLSTTCLRISKKAYIAVSANFKKGWMFRYHSGSRHQKQFEDNPSFQEGFNIADSLVLDGQKITYRGHKKYLERYLKSYNAWMHLVKTHESLRKTKTLNVESLSKIFKLKKTQSN